MRGLLWIALVLAPAMGAHAARIECDERGGHLLDMPEDADAALVSVGDRLLLVAEESARVEGAISPEEFCRDFDGQVAFVLPIPKPAVETPAVEGEPGDVDAHSIGRPRSDERQFGTLSVKLQIPERQGVEGTEEGEEEEPAPLPADIVVLDGPGQDAPGGCSTGPTGAAPWALLLLFGLRRRGLR